MAAPPPTGTLLLRVILSLRRISAEVTNLSTDSIVAMASTSEQDFPFKYRGRMEFIPRRRNLIDPTTASQIGQRLGLRLREIGVSQVQIDVDQELSRPPYQCRVVESLFDSVKNAGVCVVGDDKLPKFF